MKKINEAKKLLKSLKSVSIKETYTVDKVTFLPKRDSQSVAYKFETEKDAITFVDTLPAALKSKFKYIKHNNIGAGGRPLTSVTAIGYTSTDYDSFEKSAGLHIKSNRQENF